MDSWMNRRMVERMDGWTDGYMDGWWMNDLNGSNNLLINDFATCQLISSTVYIYGSHCNQLSYLLVCACLCARLCLPVSLYIYVCTCTLLIQLQFYMPTCKLTHTHTLWIIATPSMWVSRQLRFVFESGPVHGSLPYWLHSKIRPCLFLYVGRLALAPFLGLGCGIA